MKIVFGKKFFVVNMIRGTGQYEGLNEDDDVADRKVVTMDQPQARGVIFW